jgi:riboflavin synthase
VASVADDGFARILEVEAPEQVLRYVVEKGSIALDGVSLTVTGLSPRSFTVSLIPETLKRTTLGQARAGTRVNLEVDVLAKYVERLLAR